MMQESDLQPVPSVAPRREHQTIGHEIPASPERPHRADVDPLGPDTLLALQRSHGNRFVGNMLAAHNALLSRQPAPPPVPDPAGPHQADLSPSEAATRIELALFDSGGYFEGARSVLQNFENDMRELGWYAGAHHAGESEGNSAAKDAAIEAAKAVGKKALEKLLVQIGGDVMEGLPAVGTAAAIVSLIGTALKGVDTYTPVITERAAKPAHQVYVEGLKKQVDQEQRSLRNKWTAGKDEIMKKVDVKKLLATSNQIEQAEESLKSSYYPDLVDGYLRIAPRGREVELPTPHSEFTGESKTVLKGLGKGQFATTIRSREIYVELAASGYEPAKMNVVRTVIPELPSTVLSRLNDPEETKGTFFGNLPFERMIIEAKTPVGPARIVYQLASATFDIPEYPHYSRMFCKQIGKQSEGGHLDTGTGGGIAGVPQPLTHQEFLGAELLYSDLAGRPLSAMNFAA